MTVTAILQNTGEGIWPAGGERPFALRYRWRTADGREALRLPTVTLPLPGDVPPGGRAEMTVPLAPPLPPGSYLLAWDIYQDSILSFRGRGVPEGTTVVHILPDNDDASPPPLPATQPLRSVSELPLTVPRRDLWQAALAMWLDRPLLGAGPDNFRRLYGHYLGLSSWDNRLFANNLYLELLATTGLLGLAAFALFLLAVVAPLLRALRADASSSGALPLLRVGVAGALLAFFFHGLLDYFLGATSVAFLFWAILGLAAALRKT
jgi:hypothetical protein